jgi:hypothetical protein
MLGIVLPTLGLALLPLASTLLNGAIKPIHVFLLFNVVIPFLVFYLTSNVMLTRPGGYGETTLLEKNPMYYKYKSKKPYIKAGLLCFPLIIIGLLPFIFQIDYLTHNIYADELNPDNQALFGLKSDYLFSEVGLNFLSDGKLFGFENTDKGIVGPFGLGALLLSLLIPFSIALFFSLAYNWRTKELVKFRDDTKDLENEFVSTLFTLGNRLGDGTPAEIVFAKIASSTKGQKTENFFKIVNTNIQSMGMGLEDAVFNNSRGAIVYYPSNLIATSMRILIESVKKGLVVAAQSMMSISEYFRNIQKINERLRDLLADVVSDMRSNMNFLAPLLSGIVVGLAAMLTLILSKLKDMVDLGGADNMMGGIQTLSNIVGLFDVSNTVSPYYLQVAIGIYIIQIIFILTGTLVIVDSGEDKLKQTSEISSNLVKGGFLYLFTATLAILAFSMLSKVALSGLMPPG